MVMTGHFLHRKCIYIHTMIMNAWLYTATNSALTHNHPLGDPRYCTVSSDRVYSLVDRCIFTHLHWVVITRWSFALSFVVHYIIWGYLIVSLHCCHGADLQQNPSGFSCVLHCVILWPYLLGRQLCKLFDVLTFDMVGIVVACLSI